MKQIKLTEAQARMLEALGVNFQWIHQYNNIDSDWSYWIEYPHSERFKDLNKDVKQIRFKYRVNSDCPGYSSLALALAGVKI